MMVIEYVSVSYTHLENAESYEEERPDNVGRSSFTVLLWLYH